MTTEFNPNDAPEGYVAVEQPNDDACNGCAFWGERSGCTRTQEQRFSPCTPGLRADKSNVIFVKKPEGPSHHDATRRPQSRFSAGAIEQDVPIPAPGELLVDVVNRPPHYTRGAIECIDAIQAALTPEEFRGYCKGNALKYVWRELHKGGDESIAKAIWYLNKLKDAK